MARIASIVAKIHSENVLDVQRFEMQDGVRMMLMEWIDGYDLCRLMVNATLDRIYHRVDASRWDRINEVVLTAGPNQPRLKPGVAVAIVRSCLSALGQMHMEDIVHGDIKTSNIMLRRNGNVKLVDVGSATAWRESREPHHYTYRYAAPEVLAGRPCTPQSDLASLGYVLVELLSGRALFANLRPGSQLRRDKEAFPKRLPELLPSDVRKSEQLVALCRRLVEPDLTKRYLSAHDANYDTDCGAHTFLDRLVLVNLSTAYDHEIHLLLEALGQPRKGTVAKQGAE
jgi:serine/threonine-protein kinase